MREPLNISIDWKEKMQFNATNDKTDYKVAIDVPYLEEGGEKKGKLKGPLNLVLILQETYF